MLHLEECDHEAEEIVKRICLVALPKGIGDISGEVVLRRTRKAPVRNLK
jgi:hypothetical protein